jgi:hypothetical protein
MWDEEYVKCSDRAMVYDSPIAIFKTALSMGLQVHIICGENPIILICENDEAQIKVFISKILDMIGDLRPLYLFLVLSEQHFQSVQFH